MLPTQHLPPIVTSHLPPPLSSSSLPQAPAHNQWIVPLRGLIVCNGVGGHRSVHSSQIWTDFPQQKPLYIQHTDNQPIHQRRPNHVCLFGKMKGLTFSCEWLQVWRQKSTTCFFAELTALSSPSLPSLIYFPGYFGDSNSELNIEYWSLWEVFKSRQIGFRRTHFNALVSRQLFQCITLFTIALHCTVGHSQSFPHPDRIVEPLSYNCSRGSTEKGRGEGGFTQV